MHALSENDVAIVRSLRDAGVLQDVESHRLDQSNGVILVTCPDGDHFVDIFSHQLRMQEGQCSDPRIHPLGWHGGAIRLVAGSPANKHPGEHQIFLEEIRDARGLKGINTVALYSHAQCGKASACGVDFLQLMMLHMQAKAAVKAMNSGISVACFLHVTYPTGTRRTYFVSRPDWDRWFST
ncbi:MAG: hypothetical protein HYT31_01230 [Parcubacteria group bacterium]|nr:hypothetical protein [Parcubacteria group bacterium]